MNTKYFHGFVINVDTFHASECHLNPIHNANTAVSHFVLLGFNPD